MSTKINSEQKNVFGETLENCSLNPLTGWYRDGCCNTDENDRGLHTVCAKVTTEFLEWCKEAGNDLITPHPEFGFPGLKDGDGWCVCATWYAKAVDAGKGCPIFLKKTHENTLKVLPKQRKGAPLNHISPTPLICTGIIMGSACK